MRKGLPILILFCWSVSSQAKYSYIRWTEQGFVQALIDDSKVKTGDTDFQDLEFHQKNISVAQVQKKFAWRKQLQKVVLFGDTGCRLKDGAAGSVYQNCDDPEVWPYPRLIHQVRREKPQLVIHLGDYHYREKCTHGKICQTAGKVTGYGWAPWKLDFFAPSTALLGKAPWVFVRGNHEGCDRAHEGYGKFLSSKSWGKNCPEYEETNILVWGDLAIVNFDSSSIPDLPLLTPAEEKQWIARLQDLDQKLSELLQKGGVKTVWLVTHKPAFGMAPAGSSYVPVNVNLRKWLQSSTLASKINVIFSGHVHASNILKNDRMPLQVVEGNGGTQLDKFNKGLSDENKKALQYERVKIVALNYGYMVMTRLADNNWKIAFKNLDGSTQFECNSLTAEKSCFQ